MFEGSNLAVAAQGADIKTFYSINCCCIIICYIVCQFLLFVLQFNTCKQGFGQPQWSLTWESQFYLQILYFYGSE